VVLYCATKETLFSGDLLMAGGVGRYDLSDGNEKLLRQSLKHIMLLPDQTRVFSGHGPATTIGRERMGNMYIRQHNLGTRD